MRNNESHAGCCIGALMQLFQTWDLLWLLDVSAGWRWLSYFSSYLWLKDTALSTWAAPSRTATCALAMYPHSILRDREVLELSPECANHRSNNLSCGCCCLVHVCHLSCCCFSAVYPATSLYICIFACFVVLMPKYCNFYQDQIIVTLLCCQSDCQS